jgi:class 3 adenylate cyclase/tetratricopeptide (TPR) repeat protein
MGVGVNCQACNQENPDDAAFCSGCGGALSREPVCPACGRANTAGARFCNGCGAGLSEPAAPLRTPTPQPSRALPASFAGGRYTVKGFLGEGGRKRVYLAHDAKLDRDVAFAVIKTEGLDADGLARVKREAQAMGRLGDHPNIVTVFDTDQEGAEPYIVSQYMAGGDLAAVLQQREDHRLPIEGAVRVAEQVCSGLAHAHARGIVHRDLKPGNIWFDSSGVAKIGDFGLAVALDRSRLTMAGMMVGTASYMPPEQAMGGETTYASDLYALGCVLYEMVTGRPPFVGDDTVAVISQHVNTAPVAPTWHNAECPAGLQTLILRMLEKDAKQRPASAEQVREALASVSRGSTPAPQPAGGAPQAEEANPIYRRTFVGREPELKLLESAFDNALSGQGSLLMIVGEPGIGKTTITEQLATYVGMRGGKSLVGHCYEEGSLSLPYLAFVETMRQYVAQQDGEQLAKQLGSGAADVARIVSEVRDRVTVEPSASSSPEEERFRLFQAVTGFLRNASGAQPMCLVLEDLHDADKGTMEMLVHLSRNLAGARILLVGTYRDVEVDRTHPLSAALAELRRIESFQRIPLRGLSPDEVQRMLSHITGQEVQFVLAEAVYRQTEGNPLFIQEVIRYAAESGMIKREGGQWVATSVESLLTQIPEGLRDVIGRRLSGLSEDCNRVLSVASVIGRDFAVDVLQRVGGITEEELMSALEEAMRVSLIEDMKGGREARYRFTHAFFRQTLYEEMIAPRRLRMHNEVAKALEQHYEGRLEEHAAELAEHFSHSSTEDDLRKAVEYGQLAAARAVSVNAYSEAVRYLEQALEVQEVLDPKDGEARLELLAKLTTALLSAGEAERVLTDVGKRAFELAEALGGGTRAAHIAETAAWALIYQQGTTTFATPDYRTWCERIGAHAAPDSRERVIADVFLSWSYWFAKEQERCWDLRRRSLDLARRVGEPEALAFATFSFIFDGAPQRWDRERLQVAQEVQDVPRTGLPPNLTAQFLYSLVALFTNGGDPASADRYWRELDSYAERVPEPYVYAWQKITESTRLRAKGELEKALSTAQDLAASASTRGIALFGQLLGGYAAGPTLDYLGRFEEMEALQWVFSTLPYGEAVVAHQLAAVGKIKEARSQVRRIISEQRIAEGDDWAPDVTLANLLDAAVRVGDVESTALLYKRLAGAEDWYIFTTGTNARPMGMAALLLGDPAAARKLLETALEVAGRVGDRTETARAHFGLARVLFEHFPDEKAAAASHLNVATQEAQAMKMKPLLDDCLALKLRFQGITSTDVYTSIDTVARVVEAEKPDLRTHAAPDGTVTIMFSDIEGSTAMADRLGDKRFMEVLREHNAIIREQVKAHGGFEVKSEGDGFMVAFQSAGKALACASAIQKALATRNARVGAPLGDGGGAGGAAPRGGAGRETSVEKVMVRMGLHAGEVIKEGQDFFGRNVIMAARVASQAQGGEILTSGVLKALLQGSDVTWGESRTVPLKGLSGEHEIWALEWERP